MNSLGIVVGLMFFGAAGAGGYTAYRMAGSVKGGQKWVYVTGGVIAAPVALMAYNRYRSKRQGAALRACIDSHCTQYPGQCTQSARDNTWYLNEAGRRASGCFN